LLYRDYDGIPYWGFTAGHRARGGDVLCVGFDPRPKVGSVPLAPEEEALWRLEGDTALLRATWRGMAVGVEQGSGDDGP
jgi:hypothetical protein